MEVNVKESNVRFSKLSNLVFYGSDDVKSVLEKCDYDYKAVLALEYLYCTRCLYDDTCRFSLEDMVMSCGYKPDAHKGKVNDVFKSLLIKFGEMRIIECEIDLNKIKPKNFIMCKLSLDMSSSFVIVLPEEKEKIATVPDIDYSQLFTYYYYLKARMYKRSITEGSAVVSGGMYEFGFTSLKKMYEDLKMTDSTLIKYNKILSELDLIRYKNFGTYYYSYDKNKTTKLSPNFYTLFDGDEKAAETNLKEGFNWYKLQELNLDKVFSGSDLTIDNRSVGGKLGSLNKKEKKGTITEDELEQKEELLSFIESTHEERYMVKSAFEKMGSEMLLSEYYYDLSREDISDQYYDIETKLGLVDESTDRLSIDFDYYKWVMVNYTKDKHDYYVNCIKKHKQDNNIRTNGFVKESDSDYSAECKVVSLFG